MIELTRAAGVMDRIAYEHRTRYSEGPPFVDVVGPWGGSPCSSHQPVSWPAASRASGLGESYSCSGLQFGQLGGVVLSPFERGCPTGAGAGQDVEGQVAATLGPVVVLFGEYGADQAGDRVAVGAPLCQAVGVGVAWRACASATMAR
jgi:hypothetical protein